MHAHGWTESYAYDAAGNLTRATAPAHEASGEREFDGTLIRSARAAPRTNTTPRAAWCAGPQTAQRPEPHLDVRLERRGPPRRRRGHPDGDSWRYAYDPLGRRISKHRLADDGTAADRTDFTWDDTRLAEQTGPDGKVITWDYAPGTHRPLAQTRPQAVDRGLQRLASRAAGRGTASDHTAPLPRRRHRLPWAPRRNWSLRTASLGLAAPHQLCGAPASRHRTDDTVDCPLRFPGQYADAETGLHYNYFRYYDPENARYISPDPLGLDPAPNHHAFVENPFSWLDPLGLAPCIPYGPATEKVQNVLDRVRSKGSPFAGYKGGGSIPEILERRVGKSFRKSTPPGIPSRTGNGMSTRRSRVSTGARRGSSPVRTDLPTTPAITIKPSFRSRNQRNVGWQSNQTL